MATQRFFFGGCPRGYGDSSILESSSSSSSKPGLQSTEHQHDRHHESYGPIFTMSFIPKHQSTTGSPSHPSSNHMNTISLEKTSGRWIYFPLDSI